MVIDMEYGISMWGMVCRYGYLPHRYGHPGHRLGIWANDMGDDSIDMVILHIDMAYHVTLLRTSTRPTLCSIRRAESVLLSEHAP